MTPEWVSYQYENELRTTNIRLSPLVFPESAHCLNKRLVIDGAGFSPREVSACLTNNKRMDYFSGLSRKKNHVFGTRFKFSHSLAQLLLFYMISKPRGPCQFSHHPISTGLHLLFCLFFLTFTITFVSVRDLEMVSTHGMRHSSQTTRSVISRRNEGRSPFTWYQTNTGKAERFSIRFLFHQGRLIYGNNFYVFAGIWYTYCFEGDFSATINFVRISNRDLIVVKM